MPDDAENFKAENTADECCDLCCQTCDHAECRNANPVSCECHNNFLSAACGNTGTVGTAYSGMVSTINARLNQIGTKDVDYNIAGFAWFQGYSDTSQKPGWVEHEYEDNMVDFIKSVRDSFNESTLPFIISGPGMEGYGSRGKSRICNGQRRAADRPELNESTIYVESRIFAAKYACLNMNDTACAGLSDAGCDGSGRAGCACQDIINALIEKAPDYEEQCGYKVQGGSEYKPQGQHWNWNGRSYFKGGQKMGEVILTLTLTLTLNTKP